MSYLPFVYLTILIYKMELPIELPHGVVRVESVACGER